MKPVYFISDLHLSPFDPATADAFTDFLCGTAHDAKSLYILGDLFEYWIGDDQLDEPFFATQCRRLHDLAAKGVSLYFIPGNRDFLCARRFAQASNLMILPDPCRIEIEGEPILLAHGDLYCTADIKYQRFRKIVHHPVTQWLWLHLPRYLRQAEARRLRNRSQDQTRAKPADWTDVTPTAIEAAMRQTGVARMIHGHTHRPATHQQQAGVRHVLPDWCQGKGGYLVRNDSGWHLYDLAGEVMATVQQDGAAAA